MKRSTGFMILKTALLVSLSAVAVAAGCSSSSTTPSPNSRADSEAGRALKDQDALSVVRELAAPQATLAVVYQKAPDVGFRPHGGLLLPKPAEGVALHLSAVLPDRAGGAMLMHPITSATRSLTWTALGAAPVSAQILPDGRALYAKAFGSADLLVSYQHERVSQAIVVRDAQAPDLWVWKSDLGDDTRLNALDDGRTLLVDKDGRWALTVEPARIVDARGKERTVPVAFHDDGYARLIVDHRGLEYPFVVHLAVSAPAPGEYYGPPPTTIRGRVMVLLDTSGSMTWRFQDNLNRAGDSDSSAVFCDNNIGTGFACNTGAAVNCTLAAGSGRNLFPYNIEQSRMAASKAALQNVVNAHNGVLDFGLTRFAQDTSGTCVNADYCCNPQTNGTTQGRCRNETTINGNGNTGYATIGGWTANLTYRGGCGTGITNGGKILVRPGATGGNADVLQWVDYVENFCSSTGSVGGRPRNPELRANGSTPLARSIGHARENWYRTVWDARNTPGDPNYDALLNCRPYVLVVLTDGADTCGAGGAAEDASPQVQQLTDINSTNPVLTYVLGMGDTAGLDITELNQMTVAGGTGLTTAPIAQNQEQIEAAFADIVSRTVKFEICNRADDNCNDRYDEGLGVYQECNVAGDCAAGSSCDHGRCTCTSGAQCSTGYTCAGLETGESLRFCRPSCSAGVGACHADGLKKCGFSGSPNGCCMNDSSATCNNLTTPPPQAEICNGIDDDCDGFIDEDNVCTGCVPTPEVCDGRDNDCDLSVDADDPDLTGVGQACGTDVGECCLGITVCRNARTECDGGRGPVQELCNGLDDNCDAVIDGLSQPCYTGPAGTRDVGICHGGTQACTAIPLGPQTACEVRIGTPAWGACDGQQLPRAEVCNGLDDDCNGAIDDNVPDGFGHKTGDVCCRFPGKCGVGVCTNGAYQCVGNQVQCVGGVGPSAEVCDHLDNDCNGSVDDLPGKGTPCLLPNACSGTLECDFVSKSLKCQPKGDGTQELCNNLDDDCDGSIDEEPDVLQDPNLRGECNVPVPPNDKPPCKPGHWICRNGARDCTGSVGPGVEICNGIDDDCDGIIDTPNPCPGDTVCLEGECAARCRGEFECPGGRICINGRCRTQPGMGGAGGASGSGGAGGGIAGNGGVGGGGTGGDTGESGKGGTSGTGGITPGTGGLTGTGGDQGPSGGSSNNVFGLATGGGGCACSLPKPGPWPSTAGLSLFLLAGLRRRLLRQAGEGSAARKGGAR